LLGQARRIGGERWAKIDAELEAALEGGASAAVGSEGGAHGGANMSPSAALMEKTEL
jgi:hypothetical protein